MGITQEDIQKAFRISRAIQKYLEMSGKEGLRSTDLYPYLASKGLIEKDRHNGLHFRKFLRKLKDNNALNLLPQCTCNPAISNQFNEWYFYKVSKSYFHKEGNIDLNTPPNPLVLPRMAQNEIEILISNDKQQLSNLPVRSDKQYTIQQKETRQDYPRAYEFWTKIEIEILCKHYEAHGVIDKIAELLQRQPSAIKRKLLEIGLDNSK